MPHLFEVLKTHVYLFGRIRATHSGTSLGKSRGSTSLFLQLDLELSAVHRQLLHKNFLRVMSAQVAICIQLLADCVKENPGVSLYSFVDCEIDRREKFQLN